MRKVSCDKKASPEETFRAQLPDVAQSLPFGRYVSLRRSSSSARFPLAYIVNQYLLCSAQLIAFLEGRLDSFLFPDIVQ